MNSIETVLIMLILILIGWLLSHIGWISSEVKSFLSKLILKVSVPALIIVTFFDTLKKDMLGRLGYIAIPFMSITVLFLLSLLLAKLMKISRHRHGIFVSMSVASNSMFFGFPIALGLFGNQAVPYVVFYYIANTIFFWGILAPIIMKDGEGKTVSGFERFKNILNIPIVTVIISILLLIFNLQPPSLLIRISGYFSSLVTPLSSLVVGRIMYEIDFKKFKLDKSILAALLMKFLLSPIIIFTIARLFTLPLLATMVFTIQASMPVMMQSAIVSEASGKDSEYGAVILSISNVLCLVVIPIYMWILNSIL